jgi:hypothetical protein
MSRTVKVKFTTGAENVNVVVIKTELLSVVALRLSWMTPAAEPLLEPVVMFEAAAVVVPVTTLWLVTVMPVVVFELVVAMISAVALVPQSNVAAFAPAHPSANDTRKLNTMAKTNLGNNATFKRKSDTQPTHTNSPTQPTATQNMHGFTAIAELESYA